ncbi:MAG: hypothetical protein M3R08_07780 [Bacteroidota bacterium]|nr:hypothetical protein [Bacteroidota bacterium]
MRILFIISIQAISILAVAQYDIGGCGGIYEPHIRHMDLEPRDIPWTAAVFYRERSSDHTDLALELQLTHRRLFGSWTTAKTGSNLYVNATDLWLQHLYFRTMLDVRMSASGNVVIRFGPQFGIKLTESFTGRVTEVSDQPGELGNVEDLQRTTTDYFKYDGRFFMGMGFRIPLGTTMGIVIDPYFSAGVTQMLKEDHNGKTNEVGVRIGLARRYYNRNITQRIAGAFRGAKEESEE